MWKNINVVFTNFILFMTAIFAAFDINKLFINY